MPSYKWQIIEQALHYLRSFWKTDKNDWRERRKTNKGTWKQSQKKLDTDQKLIASSFSKDFLDEEAKYWLDKIAEIENKLSRNNS